ncbi:MAG TPA: thrombospondin type 3 repeat-containing protein [Candidatus Bipolaricaulota bacterium]|nr:thrombospondin type 3 repeat-containing protein [Candidatus Bipolaricaulota bacterium]
MPEASTNSPAASEQPKDIFAEIDHSAPVPASNSMSPAAPPAKMAAPGKANGGKKILVIFLMIIFLAIVIVIGYVVYDRYLAVPETAVTPIKNQIPIAPPATPTPTPTQPTVVPEAATVETTVVLPVATPSATVNQIDTDNDRLSDSEEKIIGTDPEAVDSDKDSLTDYEEVKIYKTDPLDPDSDDDGYKDGEEVSGGYDPLNPAAGAKLSGLPSVLPSAVE